MVYLNCCCTSFFATDGYVDHHKETKNVPDDFPALADRLGTFTPTGASVPFCVFMAQDALSIVILETRICLMVWYR